MTAVVSDMSLSSMGWFEGMVEAVNIGRQGY